MNTGNQWPQLIKCSLVALSLAAFSGAVSAQQEKRCDKTAATLLSSDGEVVYNVGDGKWQDAKIKYEFCYGDTIKVLSQRAALRLENDTLVRLNKNTTIKLVPPDKSFWVQVIEGASHFLSRTPKQFNVEVKEPYVNASIDGTEFTVTAIDGKTTVTVIEGQVTTDNNADQAVLTSGDQASTAGRGSFIKAEQIRLADAASWSLNYPPIVTEQDVNDPQIKEFLRQGDFGSALNMLSNKTNLSTAENDLKAALFLYAGETQQAKNIVVSAPTSALSRSTEVLIALIEGDKEKAIALNDGLVKQFPNNSSALLTATYVKQAQFDLKGAYTLIQSATKTHSKDALLWARQAELALSLDKTKEAQKAVNTALEISPRFYRAKILNGFIQLKKGKLKLAQHFFNQVVDKNNADPLAQFALSLTEVKSGDLADGRARIELAALLDPSNSLYRSYLGKAYLDEYRFEVASDQFELARQFDPQDPTPDFYEAVQLQSQNRPIEALEKIEESIVKNDNRAVYRSRMLLDSDAAARGANLADIYLDLGLPEQARLAAGQALAQNPNEYSAHRLMAQALANDPQADAARASEVLQAQMNQPLLSTPIRSILSEQDLLVLDGTGPSEFGINEYNTMFQSNEHHVSVGGIGGNDNTSAGDIFISGLQGKVAYALEHYEYKTKGYQENADQAYKLSSAFIQYQPFPFLNMFVEHTERDGDRGDLSEVEFLDLLESSERLKENKKSDRFGLKFDFLNYFDLQATFLNTEEDLKKEEISVLAATPLFKVSNETENLVNDEVQSFESKLTFQNSLLTFSLGFHESETKISNISESVVITPPPTLPPLPPKPVVPGLPDQVISFPENILEESTVPVTKEVIRPPISAPIPSLAAPESDNIRSTINPITTENSNLNMAVVPPQVMNAPKPIVVDLSGVVDVQKAFSNLTITPTSWASIDLSLTRKEAKEYYQDFRSHSENLHSASLLLKPNSNLMIKVGHFELFSSPIEVSSTLQNTSSFGTSVLIDENPFVFSKNKNIELNFSRHNLNWYLAYTDREIRYPRIDLINNFSINVEESKIVNHLDYRWSNITIKLSHISRKTESPFQSFNLPTSLRTTEMPLSINYYSANGIKVALSHIIVDQDAAFLIEPEAPSTIRNSEKFAVVDLSINYRFIDSQKNKLSFGLAAKNLLGKDFSYQDQNFLNFTESTAKYIPFRTLLFSINGMF